MQNKLISNEFLQDSKVDINSNHYQKGYQQALDDFAIAELVTRLQTYTEANSNTTWIATETQDTENLTVLLIQGLTANLNDQLIAYYLEVLGHSQSQPIGNLSLLQQFPISVDLPASFPNVEMPQFSYGDRLRWISDKDDTDRGVVIGRFYSFAPHRCCWQWCYLIWLDSDSLSSR